MNDGLIPNRYAKALYKAATEQGTAEQVYAAMKRLEGAFAAEPACSGPSRTPIWQPPRSRSCSPRPPE